MAKLVETPAVYPASCLLCGTDASNPDRKYWMDVEKYAEDWGNIYFCNECFEYMVREVDPTFGTGQSASPTSDQEVERLRERLRRCEQHFGSIANSLGLDLFSDHEFANLVNAQASASIDVVEQPNSEGNSSAATSEGSAESPTPAGSIGVDESAIIIGFNQSDADHGFAGDNVQGNVGDISVPPERDVEPFRGSLGKLPIIASEFGVDEGSDQGFSLRDL